VVNSILDALRPLGVRDVVMPCTPERVWRAIQSAQGGEQASASQQHEARQSDRSRGNSRPGMVSGSDEAQQSGGAA
jgi:carbon-monoxide dehydrogenase large subunit